MVTAACQKDNGPKLDFNITVPSDWFYYVYANEGFVYYAVSPVKNENDSITEDITILKYTENIGDLQTFYTSYVTGLAKDTSYHQISVADTTINGEEAIKLTHLQSIPAINTARNDTVYFDAQMQKYIMTNKSNGYVLSFNALRSSFKEFQPIFDTIISTFTFKD